jgi:hypothetical protein
MGGIVPSLLSSVVKFLEELPTHDVRLYAEDVLATLSDIEGLLITLRIVLFGELEVDGPACACPLVFQLC